MTVERGRPYTRACRDGPDVDVDALKGELFLRRHEKRVEVSAGIGTGHQETPSERHGLERFRTEQPNYSILNRAIENEVLPVAERYGMGVLVWSPLAQGLLAGRVRKGQPNDLRRTARFRHLSDEGRIDMVERIIPVADEAGLKLTHLAMAFVIARPGVTSAIAGPRTMEQLDDLLAGSEVSLTDGILDRIDAIVTSRTDVGALDMAYRTPGILNPALRRRPLGGRPAA